MQMDAEYFFPISPIRRPHIQQPIKASCLYLYQLGRNHIAEKTMAIEKHVNMHVSSMCVCERDREREGEHLVSKGPDQSCQDDL